MVEIIGLATVVAMSWLLAFAMANESDAEKRRRALPGAQPIVGQESATWFVTKRAA